MFNSKTRVAAALCMAAAASPVLAQQYPSRPIHLIAAAAPGGSSDILARRLATIIQEQTGATVIVDNKGGGSGSIGLLAAARAPADGYTVVIGNPDPVTIFPMSKKPRPYELEKDLVTVAQVAETHFVFAVSAKLPANNLSEFAAYVKARPGQLNYASAGNATSGRLVTEMLKQKTGIELQHVPYKSTAPALQAVATGETAIMATSVTSMKALMDSGLLKAIGIARESRLPTFRNIPTTSEGGLANFIVPVWMGIFSPPGIPEPIAEKLSAMFINAVNSEDFKVQAATLGLDAKARGRAEFTKFLRADTKMWEETVRSANISLED